MAQRVFDGRLFPVETPEQVDEMLRYMNREGLHGNLAFVERNAKGEVLLVHTRHAGPDGAMARPVPVDYPHAQGKVPGCGCWRCAPTKLHRRRTAKARRR